MQPQILFEDNHLLVINKPAGMLAQGDNTKDLSVLEILKNTIKTRDKKPGKVYLGLVHRLDRPTSGVMVLAKTSKALSRLNKQFIQKTTSKIYWAIISGVVTNTPTKLSHFLVKNQSQNKSYAHRKKVPNSKFSELIYYVKLELERYTLLEIELLTGRHHQIRAQLCREGITIKGDLKYGAKRPNKDSSIHLHARKLAIMHPTTKELISFTAPPPKDALWNAVVD